MFKKLSKSLVLPLGVAAAAFVPATITSCSSSKTIEPKSSYEWLKQICQDIPKRKSGTQYNSDELYQNKMGEKYAADYLIKEIEKIGYSKIDNTSASNNLPNDLTNTNSSFWQNEITNEDANKLLEQTGVFNTKFKWKDANSSNSSQNIIININKSNGKDKDFWIASHYDTQNSQNYKVGAPVVNDGANDNSSGIATSLAIAEYFFKKENREKLKFDLHILIPGAEEVGVYGTKSFVQQFIKNKPTIKKQTLGMINLDSVAGGDFVYVHSPQVKDNNPTSFNTDTKIRNKLNQISNDKLSLHLKINDPNAKTNWKGQPLGQAFNIGETGDWSDHGPFYKEGIEVAYIESTNFRIRGKNAYDGYSQTTNSAFWKQKMKTLDISATDINNKEKTITLYIPEKYWDQYPAAQLKDISTNYQENPILFSAHTTGEWGELWHTESDTIEKLESAYPGRLNTQMKDVFDSLIKYIETYK